MLYVDNFSGHKTTLNLENIELKFLPPNTTSLSQPLDMGIIKNVKFHYRRLLLRDRISKLDGGKSGKDLEINLLEAVRLLDNAWTHVTAKTIRNCFRHAKFWVHVRLQLFDFIIFRIETAKAFNSKTILMSFLRPMLKKNNNFRMISKKSWIIGADLAFGKRIRF